MSLISDYTMSRLRADLLQELVVSKAMTSAPTKEWKSFIEHVANATKLQSVVVDRLGDERARRLKEVITALRCHEVARVNRFARNRPNPGLSMGLQKLEIKETSLAPDCRGETAIVSLLMQILTEDHAHTLQTLKIQACRLSSSALLHVARQARSIQGLQQLHLCNSGGSPGYANACDQETGKAVLDLLRHKDLVELRLPWESPCSEDSARTITEFLTTSQISRLHLGSQPCLLAIKAIYEALAGDPAIEPPRMANFKLTELEGVRAKEATKDLEPLFERNRLLREASEKLKRLKRQTAWTDNLLWTDALDGWGREDWLLAHAAMKLIVAAKQVSGPGIDDLFPAMADEHPLLIALYLHKGLIGEASLCVERCEDPLKKLLTLTQLPLHIQDGPFLASPEHRLLAFFVQPVMELESKEEREQVLQQSANSLLEELVGDQELLDTIKLRLTENDPHLDFSRKLGTCMRNWLEAMPQSVLERNQGSIKPTGADLESLWSWIHLLYDKERHFRMLLGYFQDHRYGDQNVEVAVNTVSQEWLMSALGRFYPSNRERLWVLEHLLSYSKANQQAYSRKNQIYLLNINGVGLKLRQDGVRLSKTQIEHYDVIKSVGIEIVRALIDERGMLGDDEKHFVEKQTGFFDFHRSHYDRFAMGTTHSRKKVSAVLRGSRSPEAHHRRGSIQQADDNEV